jgi:GAF domain-containing protein
MLISNLMLNIQTHAQKLASEYVADLVSNERTPHVAKIAREDLERVAVDIYARLSDWLAEKHADELGSAPE